MKADSNREQEIFFAALEISDQEARHVFLTEACGTDEELLRRFKTLLRIHEPNQIRPEKGARDGNDITVEFSDQKSEADIFPFGATAIAGQTLAGKYRLLSEVGEGGMGMVWLADQIQPVRRKVAIKLIKMGMDSRAVLARFEAERQALAIMDHPNIAKILDGGMTGPDSGAIGAGRPYFVMEYVQGVSITQYCDDFRLKVRERLSLFMLVCQAVQHAHQKGVIHRDLKPSNILICQLDGRPVPKVIDFGLAKALGQSLTEQSLHTAAGLVLGTPLYMSPEQANQSNLDIDTRTDIYSLGVVLYELLTGTTPIERKRFKEIALDAFLKIIRDEDPPIPSLRISSAETRANIAARRDIEPKQLSKNVRGDLDWIAMKSLDKDRNRRYASANDLAIEIQRFLAGEPIEAAPPKTIYRLSKFLRKHRFPVAIGVTMVLLLLGGLVGTGTGWKWAFDEKTRAQKETIKAIASQRAESVQHKLADARLVQVEQNLKRAELAELELGRRADELQKVSDFQAGQLAIVEPELMGSRLRNSLVEQQKLFLVSRGMDEIAVKAEMEAMDQAMSGVNFTNTAIGTLKENVFTPAEKTILKDFANQPLVQANLLQTLAYTMQKLGLLEPATVPQLTALNLYKQIQGEEHLDTLASSLRLSSLLQSQGKVNEAKALLSETLITMRRILGEDHPETISATENMATILLEEGNYSEAEKLFVETLDKSRRVMGEDDPATISATNNLATFWIKQGKMSKAEVYLRETLEKRRRLSGENDEETITTINSLGACLDAQGRYPEAQVLFQDALEKMRRVKGDEHPNTLGSIHNMGHILSAQGELSKAEVFLREAMDKRRRVLGSEHSATISSMGQLGNVLMSQDNLTEAEPLLIEAMERGRRILGNEHPDTLLAINNLGVLLVKQGKHSQAEPYLREALEISRRKLGNQASLTVTLVGNMGAVLRTQNKLAESELFFREALENARQGLGDEHPITIRLLIARAKLLWQLGRYDESIPEYEELVAFNQKTLGPKNFGTLAAKASLGVNLRDAGQLDKAILLLEEVTKKGSKFDALRNVQVELIETYIRADRRDEAMTLIDENIRASRLSLPTKESDLATALSQKGRLLMNSKEFATALPMLRESLDIRNKNSPTSGHTFFTMSKLGECLAGQGKLEEAEQLLLSSYEGIVAPNTELPPEHKFRIRECIKNLVDFYALVDQPERKEEWMKKLSDFDKH